ASLLPPCGEERRKSTVHGGGYECHENVLDNVTRVERKVEDEGLGEREAAENRHADRSESVHEHQARGKACSEDQGNAGGDFLAGQPLHNQAAERRGERERHEVAGRGAHEGGDAGGAAGKDGEPDRASSEVEKHCEESALRTEY